MPTATARHILVESEAKCLQVKAEIESGANFTDAAKKYSSCPSSAQGGDLGSFRPGQMVKEFENAAFNLQKGQLSTIVKCAFRFLSSVFRLYFSLILC